MATGTGSITGACARSPKPLGRRKARSGLGAALLLVSVAFGLLSGQPATAAPNIVGMPFLRGLPPDIIFRVGVPETKEIPLALFFAPLSTLCHDETWISSSHASVDIVAPCYPLTGCPNPQLVEGIDAYNDSTGSGYDHSFTLRLQYDGGGTASTAGKIEFLADVGCSEFSVVYRLVGSINFHIVAASAQWTETTFQVSSPSQSPGSSFQISHALINGRPDAVLIVTPVANYTSTYAGNAVGVRYESTPARWTIFDETGAVMPSQQRFNVTFAGYVGQRALVHQTTAGNISWSESRIDDPRLNNNPYARLFVTHNGSPVGLAANTFNAHVGVFYNSSLGRWTIYRESGDLMATGKTFNVLIGAAPLYQVVGLWPTTFEAPSTDGDDVQVHFTHVYQNPFNGSGSAVYNFAACAHWTHTCHPVHGCVEWVVPGNSSSAASTSYWFNRWVPYDVW